MSGLHLTSSPRSTASPAISYRLMLLEADAISAISLAPGKLPSDGRFTPWPIVPVSGRGRRLPPIGARFRLARSAARRRARYIRIASTLSAAIRLRRHRDASPASRGIIENEPGE